jgi:flagellum-specific ATP synthase
VFSYLPRLLERAGNNDLGTITGFFTVLVEGDDMTEPVADTVRSILDGHIVLTRALAERNHYPAIDPLTSLSRVMPAIVPAAHLRNAGAVRASLAEYEGAKDLIEVGAYAPGSNPAIDEAIVRRPSILHFLTQTIEETIDVEGAGERLAAIISAAIPAMGQAAGAAAGGALAGGAASAASTPGSALGSALGATATSAAASAPASLGYGVAR